VGEDQLTVTNLEMVQQILAAVGDVSGETIAALVEQRFGVHIEPKFIPIYKASIRDKQRLEPARPAPIVEQTGTSPSNAG
jgi:hypothetical protein